MTKTTHTHTGLNGQETDGHKIMAQTGDLGRLEETLASVLQLAKLDNFDSMLCEVNPQENRPSFAHKCSINSAGVMIQRDPGKK